MRYFNIKQGFFITSMDISIEEIEKLDKFLEILEESKVGEIISQEININEEGRPGYNPYDLFAGIIYGFSIHSGSVRKIEESFKYDLRFRYIMGSKMPTYVTISKFLNNVVVKHSREIYSCIVKSIIQKYNIDISDVFIDGTKIEANANKYKYKWKPTTFKAKLNEKMRVLILKHFSISENKKTFISKELAFYVSKMIDKIKELGINLEGLKRGRGYKVPEIVIDYNTLLKGMNKMLEYEEIEEVCGPLRNSYYTTDKDATAMCLKEDYYSGLGSNMKAGYNLQIAVSKGIILDFMVSQERSDFKTLIPFLEIYYQDYGNYPRNLCADAGYGSFENYKYIQEKKIINYVKYQYWQKDVNGERIELF